LMFMLFLFYILINLVLLKHNVGYMPPLRTLMITSQLKQQQLCQL